jgi:hypothetical protein
MFPGKDRLTDCPRCGAELGRRRLPHADRDSAPPEYTIEILSGRACPADVLKAIVGLTLTAVRSQPLSDVSIGRNGSDALRLRPEWCQRGLHARAWIVLEETALDRRPVL